ncbi:MAG: PUR family DNA/RNA-binding protein [Bacteroidetes bacterium]|nr:PUR family DNA/RNA-binding protein [Bacteroidota bacterium]
MEFNEQNDREEIYSKPVRAGKRTYFFDVKSTRGDDLYLTITESKKRFRDDGTFFYEKHKIFLYKEDFEKFAEGLNDAVAYISENNNGGNVSAEVPSNEESSAGSWSNLNFEDLDGQS